MRRGGYAWKTVAWKVIAYFVSIPVRFRCVLPMQCALPMQCVRPMQCAPPLQCARTVVPPHHMLHHCTQLLGRHNLLCCIGRAYDMAVWTQKATRLKAPTVEVSALERMLTKLLTARGSRDLDGLLHDLAGQTSKTAPRPADMQHFEDLLHLVLHVTGGVPSLHQKETTKAIIGCHKQQPILLLDRDLPNWSTLMAVRIRNLLKKVAAVHANTRACVHVNRCQTYASCAVGFL